MCVGGGEWIWNGMYQDEERKIPVNRQSCAYVTHLRLKKIK